MDFLQEAENWVSIKEAADKCHVSKGTMERYVRTLRDGSDSRKYIKAFSGRYILYHWRNIQEYILDFNDKRRKGGRKSA